MLLAVLAIASVGTAGHGAVAVDGRISEFSYSGDERFTSAYDESYVWLSGNHEFAVTLTSSEGLPNAAVCVVAGSEGDVRSLGCASTSVPADGAREVAVPVDSLPANLTGELRVRAVLRVPNASGEVVDARPLSVTVVRRDGDLDGDGLTNEREASAGTNLRTADTDGDGLDDGAELDAHGSSPTNADTDGDGLEDRAEVEDHQTDPTAADTDGDGLQDDGELERETNPNREDTDGDGLDDAAEVNTYDTEPTDPDTDGDGLDDGAEVEAHETDPTDRDTDDDALTDNLEVNTYGTDPHGIDTDGDGLDDGAEVEEYGTDPAEADSDGDGLDDGTEVNTYGTSPTVPDTDGDGLDDGAEVDRHGTNPNEADTDGDGVSDRQEVDEGVLGGRSLPVLVGLAVAILAGAGVLYAVVRPVRVPSVRLPFVADGSREAASEDDADHRGTGSEAEGVPTEFLPNHEQVLALLDERGGQVRQSEIVRETGWSKSKVSRVLSQMEADGLIAKIDVGRENVVVRPEDVPRGVRSPFEE